MRTTRPTVVVAPDSFKGTISAPAVADAIGQGIERGGLAADRCPAADGGEGTLVAIVAARGGEVISAPAHDPLGRPVTGCFALLDGGTTAVVETATASGLALLTDEERDPCAASTYGTGELISAALDAGASEVLVAVGGSATVDGGDGALRALARRRGALGGARITLLCDVWTPWERCAQVYGPQKGADQEITARLGRRLDEQAAVLRRDPRGVPGTGAAGGLSGALWSNYGASIQHGAARVLEAIEFDARLAGAIAVVCGEGRLDTQSVEGKLVGEICERAARAGVPAHAIVGQRDLDEESQRTLGLSSIAVASTPAELEDAGDTLARRLVARHPAVD